MKDIQEMLNPEDFAAKKIVIIGALSDLPNDLRFQNDNIRLYRGAEFIDQISCHLVLCVFVVGGYTISDQLLKNLRQYGISLFLVGYTYKISAAFYANSEGNYLLRQKQYTLSTQQAFQISQKIVLNKVSNQQKLAQLPIEEFNACQQSIINTTDNQQLLGFEGNWSKKFFQSYFATCGYRRRAPQTKEDELNLLLDLGYSMLFNYIDALLRLFGFDTYKGFYHQLFFQRQSLSCDIIEPFRCIIDRGIHKAFNLKQVNPKDFIFKNDAFAFCDFKAAQKYMHFFSKNIAHHQEDIYNYILDFYRHFMKDEYSWKDFSIC